MDCSMPSLPVHRQLPEFTHSCPLSRWCHPAISSSVIPFSSCLQSFPASGSFQMSWFFASGGQRTGVSASVSVLPVNTQDWSPLGWTGWISLQSKGLSRVFSNTTVQKHQYSLVLSFLDSPALTSIHDYWKNHSFDGKLFYLSVVNLQCCVNSYCTLKWYAYILFHILFHDGLITGLCCYSFCIPLLSSPSPKFSIHPSLPTLAKAIPFSVSGSLFLFRR